jgi:chitinase
MTRQEAKVTVQPGDSFALYAGAPNPPPITSGTPIKKYVINLDWNDEAVVEVYVGKMPQPTITAIARPPPKRSYAFCPYVDVLLWPTPDLKEMLSKSHADRLTLAFVTARGTEAYWGGIQPPDWTELRQMVTAIGPQKCVAAFGGANGMELAQAITDAGKLVTEYRKIIDAYKFDMIEFDIEGAATEDWASIQRRNTAICALNKMYPDLKINYCLPVMPSGLVASGLAILRDAKAKGCRIYNVNIMAMDYGPEYCYSDMGQAAVDAAKATRTQLANIGMNAKVGVTPMIGTNDVTCEKFSTGDASVLVNFAQGNSFINLLAYWEQAADPKHDYINIFKTFH